MAGPLPDPNRRRRNAPTIPTTKLPAGGRKGRAPAVPSWTSLSKAGRAWWSWAWSTPQAAGWGVGAGFESLVARRASLEDDLSALAAVEGLDVGGLLGAESFRELRAVIQRVASLATGRLQIFKEIRELDDRLGLTPKGLAALRWTIVEENPAKADQSEVTRIDDYRARLS